MRRPLAIAGFTYIITLIAASFFGYAVNAAMSAFFLLCAAVVFFALPFLKFKKETTLVFCTAAVALAAISAADYYIYQPVLQLDSKEAVVTGTIVGLPQESYGKYYYTVKTSSIDVNGNVQKISTKIRIAFDEELEAQPYDTVSVDADLYLPSDNYGSGYSSRSYYKSKGIYLFGAAQDTAAVTKNNNPPLLYYAYVLRQRMLSAIYGNISGEQGALAAGILIGDTSELSDGVVKNFRTTGISHLLAVSGTQTSLIAQYLLLLFIFLRLPKRGGCVLSMAGVTVFMAVTGFSPSVTRAGIMSILFLAALMVKRDADAITSLAFSGMLLCLVNPFAAMDIGLLLSFTATLGLITISTPLNAAIKKASGNWKPPLRKILLKPVSILCETVGASLLTFPVIMLTFGQISLVALASNLLEVPVSLLVTLLTAVIVLLAPLRILFFITIPLSFAVKGCCAFMMWYASLLASVPFASVSSAYGFVNLFLLCCACIAAAYLLFRKKGAHVGICIVCCCLVLSVGIFTFTVASKGVLTVAALPVGYSGDCTVLVQNGRAVVIGLTGSYPETKVENYLQDCNIKSIDALILTSYSKDCVDSANNLLGSVSCGKIYCTDGFDTKNDTFLTPISGEAQLKVLDGVTLTLAPQSSGTIFTRVSYGGSTVDILGSGSLDTDIVESAGAADALIFNCSVSKSLAETLSAVYAISGSSDTALYSCANLEIEDCSVFKTSDSGIVRLLTRGNGKYLLNTGG